MRNKLNFKTSSKILLINFYALFSTVCVGQIASQMDAVVNEHVTNDQFSGIVILTNGDKIIYEKNIEFSNEDKKVPPCHHDD